MPEKWDVFVSHASEDKESFVEPLVYRLQELSVRVWYDKFVLEPGHSLTEKIAEGLANSRSGILVLSPAFLEKNWTKYEVSGLVNQFVEYKKRLIPIWLGISKEQVSKFNPTLADLFAIDADPQEIDDIALQVIKTVRPQLYTNLLDTIRVHSRPLRIVEVPIDKLRMDGPIRHHDLPEQLLIRIQNVWFATRDVFSISLEESIENIQKDLNPEREVETWERIICLMQSACDSLPDCDLGTKKEVFQLVLGMSARSPEAIGEDIAAGRISMNVADAVVRSLEKFPPKVTISDVDDTGQD